MKQPTISQARAICDALKARGVIVLAFSRDNVAGASYGETKLECKQLGNTLGEIIAAFQVGTIMVWEERNPVRPSLKTAEIGLPLEELAESVGDCGTCGRPSTLCYCTSRRSNR